MASALIKLEFGNVGFFEEGTNNKLNPHMTPGPGIEPGIHWWKVSALTTAPSLLAQLIVIKFVTAEAQLLNWA